MRVIATLFLLVGACVAEQERQDKKTPTPNPLPADDVAATVSALLKSSGAAGDWCKTPVFGLILGQQDKTVQKLEPTPKPDPLPRRD